MKDLKAIVLAVLSMPAALAAGDKDAAPALTEQHWNAARTFTFNTPAGWTSTSKPGDVETTEARGEGLIFRVLRRAGAIGLDAMHTDCMMARLAGPMDTKPGADYEYDFIGGEVAGHKALDSAFVVEYAAPFEGERKWRQRNLTLVNDNESVCVITYAPNPLYKKSKAVRKLLTSLVESVKWP